MTCNAQGDAGSELLLPGRIRSFKEVVADAYAAYTNVETTVDSLGQALEEERKRLDRAVQRYGDESEPVEAGRLRAFALS